MIDLGLSPCPNDTFIFYHLQNDDPEIKLEFADVEELNRRALYKKQHALTKLSFYAILKCKSDYQLLDCGGAMGNDCGPLLIGATSFNGDPKTIRKIAIPGQLTTAALLLDLFLAESGLQNVERVPLRYDLILPALTRGEFDAGLIIHEERFTFARAGFSPIVDLGEWWQNLTGHPIPLGGIVARKLNSEKETMKFVERMQDKIRSSLDKAWGNPSASAAFVKQYSQSLEDDVIQSHIKLYVNDFTRNLGQKGFAAIDELEKRAVAAGLLEPGFNGTVSGVGSVGEKKS